MTVRRLIMTTTAAAALLLVGACGGGDADTAAETTGGAEPAATTPAEEASPTAEASPTEGTAAGDGPTEDATTDGITFAEVQENATAESCWAVIDGTVYDLTDWIGQHPGGPDRIEQLCGTDGTDLFTGQHAGQSGPEAQLAEFEIGQLAG